ncbi:hypothetical protein Avbf_16820 [Armadillidium vulgare]|nr:hypothetical protein Avbf_16820 [Armadillidium vulgare]
MCYPREFRDINEARRRVTIEKNKYVTLISKRKNDKNLLDFSTLSFSITLPIIIADELLLHHTPYRRWKRYNYHSRGKEYMKK